MRVLPKAHIESEIEGDELEALSSANAKLSYLRRLSVLLTSVFPIIGGPYMTLQKGLIVVAGLTMANVAYAEEIPSNKELFRMLKEQQRTISELRAELKQTKQEQRAAGTNPRREGETAARQAGREAARETVAAPAPAQAYAMYTNGPAVPSARGAYASIFGGGGIRSGNNVSQLGTVFFIEAQGGPMAVNAKGQTNSNTVGFVGAHIGHEWSYGSRLLPALEIEGLYLARSKQNATLENPNPRIAEQTFDVGFSTHTAVVLANTVIGFRTPYQSVTPYIGVGIGAAYTSIDDASSTQINPLEAGFNHFNSGTSSSAWSFAAQAKAGVRVALGNNAYLFGDYRYLYVGSADHLLGSTDYPTHAPTSPWTARVGDTSYNLATFGMGVSF